MPRKLIVPDIDYAKLQCKPQSFEEFAALFSAEDHGPLGLWCLKQINKYSGEVEVEQWRKNALLDTGALGALKNAFSAAGAVVAPFNQIAITTACGATTISGALVSGTQYGPTNGTYSLNVSALPAAIAATTGGVATVLLLGNPFGQFQLLTLAAAASASATSITVNTFVANANYSAATSLVPQANEAENPSALSGTVSYSGTLSTFTYSGSGKGNRQVYMPVTFTTTNTGQPGGSATTGSYTEAWCINHNPVNAVGQCGVHVTFAPMTVNGSSNFQVNVVEKI